MFETIGHPPDADVQQRRAWATVSTLLLTGLCSGILTQANLDTTSPAKPVPDLSTDMVEIVITEPAPLRPPDLPSAPSSAPAAPAVPSEPQPAALPPSRPEDSEQAPEQPTPLDSLADEPPTAPPAGTTAPRAPAGGAPPLPDGGKSTESTPASRTATSLTVQSRVHPEYPGLARGIGLRRAECLCTVGIRRNGVPFSVDVEGCSVIFHGAARRALMGWRWNPVPEHLDDPVYTKIAVIFDRD